MRFLIESSDAPKQKVFFSILNSKIRVFTKYERLNWNGTWNRRSEVELGSSDASSGLLSFDTSSILIGSILIKVIFQKFHKKRGTILFLFFFLFVEWVKERRVCVSVCVCVCVNCDMLRYVLEAISWWFLCFEIYKKKHTNSNEQCWFDELCRIFCSFFSWFGR